MLRRASDNTTCTMQVSGSGGVDTGAGIPCGGQTVTAWLNGTTGYVTTAYDQSGNGMTLSQATAARQPQFALSGCNGFPCMQLTASNSTGVATGTITSVNQPYSFLAAAEYTSLSSYNGIIAGPLVALAFTGGGLLQLSAGAIVNSSSVVPSSVLNILQGVADGTNSIVNVEGTETAGSAGANALGTQLAVGWDTGTAYMTGYIGEAAFYGVAVPSGNRTSLCHNAYLYYATAPAC